MCNGEKRHTTVDQTGMTFGVRFRSETSIGIAAGHDKIDGTVYVDGLLLILVIGFHVRRDVGWDVWNTYD